MRISKMVKNVNLFLVVVAIFIIFCSQGMATSSEANKPTILRMTAGTNPDTVDPAKGIGINELAIFVNLYESLVVPSKIDSSPEPFLATNWTVSEDGKTWVFKLREDVKFSDGTPFTAADVKYSMDRMISIGEGIAFVFKDFLDAVNIVDDYTVEFILSKPFGPFLSTLTCFKVVNKTLVKANTLPDGFYGENGDYGTDYLLTHSAGSGPYVIEKINVHESVELKKNSNYWRKISNKAPDKVLRIELREPSTTKLLMANGEIDMVYAYHDKVTIQALIKNKNVKYAIVPNLGLNYFMINTKKVPTDDIHIRKAISYAANYAEMREFYGGMPEAFGPVPPALWGASKNFNTYDYNPEKAKEEIALSKYANNLEDYPISLASIQGNGDTGKLTMILANDLESCGFNVTVNEVPWVLFCNNEKTIETSPNITNAFCSANYPEAGSILEFKYASWATGNWNQNEWLLDEKLDSMILDAFGTINADARKQKYSDIQKYLMNDVVPSLYPFAAVFRPVWNADVFTWSIGEGKAHPVEEYNYYFADFEMKQ